MIIRGRGVYTEDKLAIWGAKIPPILPHNELVPTAVLLKQLFISRCYECNRVVT